MDMNFVVGGIIAVIVIADVLYLLWQKRRGVSSCGCSGCSGCSGNCGSNVSIDTGEQKGN